MQPLFLHLDVGGLQHHRIAEAAVAQRALRERADGGGEPLGGRRVLRHDGADDTQLGRRLLAVHLGEQVRLRREVQVHRAGGQPGRGRHRRHLHFAPAAMRHEPERRAHEPLARFGPLAFDIGSPLVRHGLYETTEVN